MKKNSTFSILLISFLLGVLSSSIFEPLRYLKYVLPLLPCVLYFALDRKRILSNRMEFNYFVSFAIFYLVLIAFLFAQNIFYSNLPERFLPNAIFILSPLLFIFLFSPFFKKEEIKQYVLLIFHINVLKNT